MNRLSRIANVTLIVVLMQAASAFSQQKRVAEPSAVSAGPASAAERAALLEQFVAKWSLYARDTYGTDLVTWPRQLSPLFESGDATNIREAVARETFEGAIATLKGQGHRVTDAAAVSRTGSAAGADDTTPPIAYMLGALSNDLVYTPLPPCRILDTRNTGAGVIAAGATRSFNAMNQTNFTAQGGSATSCGTLGLAATAVAINLTAVTPSAAGYATVYPFGTTQPVTASLNYAAGGIVNNALIAQIPNPLSTSDFTIYTLAASHYVADIVGYFAPPVATALQCTSVDGTLRNLTAGEYALLSTVNCPTGYSAVSAAFTGSQDVLMADSYVSTSSVQIFVKNVSGAAQQAIPKAICCRVPGR